MSYISQFAGYSFPAYYELRPRSIVSRTCPVQDSFYSVGRALNKRPGLLKVGLLGGLTYFLGKKFIKVLRQRWGTPAADDGPPRSQGAGLVKSLVLAGLGVRGANQLSQGALKPFLMSAVALLGLDKFRNRPLLLRWGALGAVGIGLFQMLRAGSKPPTTPSISPQAFFAYADALIGQRAAIAKQRFELQVFREHKPVNSSAAWQLDARIKALDIADKTLRQKLAALAMAL